MLQFYWILSILTLEFYTRDEFYSCWEYESIAGLPGMEASDSEVIVPGFVCNESGTTYFASAASSITYTTAKNVAICRHIDHSTGQLIKHDCSKNSDDIRKQKIFSLFPLPPYFFTPQIGSAQQGRFTWSVPKCDGRNRAWEGCEIYVRTGDCSDWQLAPALLLFPVSPTLRFPVSPTPVHFQSL